VTSLVRVFDASPLIALHQIGRLGLVESLFDRIVIPAGVEREIAPSVGAPPSWMSVLPAPDVLHPTLAAADLDLGETEAIGLALQERASIVVLDDLSARITAERLGLNVIGTLGLILLAKRKGLIDRVRPEVDALLVTGFYAGRTLYLRVLADAGESDWH
jgi:predicted nucleic acid-binding protein